MDSTSESEDEFEDEEVEDFRFRFDFFFASFFDFCCLTDFLGDFDRDGFELERDRRSCFTILEFRDEYKSKHIFNRKGSD